MFTPASWHLQKLPECVSKEDAARLEDIRGRSIRDEAFLFEEMLDKYQHPHFMLLMADSLFQLQSDAMGLKLCLKAQRISKDSGLMDQELDDFITNVQSAVEEKAERLLSVSEQTKFLQRWSPTKQHKFPLTLPQLPPGHDILLRNWEDLKSGNSTLLDRFMRSYAIDTNEVENVFSLNKLSYMDLIIRGIAYGTVSCVSEDDMLHDPEIIKDIMNDTLAAYDYLEDLVKDPQSLSPEVICRIHARLMKSSRILPNSSTYISPGVTRTNTRKTVVIAGTYALECCPYYKVDEELEYICRMAKQYIKNWRNPFSTASWVHLILARCHPFEDGDGRLARMIASVPLLRCGYPPIYIAASQKQAYYDGLRMAGEGNHRPFIECIFQSMEENIASIKNLPS